VNRVIQNKEQRADAVPGLLLAWVRQSVIEHNAEQKNYDDGLGGKCCVTAEAKPVQWGIAHPRSDKEKGFVSIQGVTKMATHTPQKDMGVKLIEHLKDECLIEFIIKSEQLFTIMPVSVSKKSFPM
jgi:hypothetical protein